MHLWDGQKISSIPLAKMCVRGRVGGMKPVSQLFNRCVLLPIAIVRKGQEGQAERRNL